MSKVFKLTSLSTASITFLDEEKAHKYFVEDLKFSSLQDFSKQAVSFFLHSGNFHPHVISWTGQITYVDVYKRACLSKAAKKRHGGFEVTINKGTDEWIEELHCD